MSQTHHLIATLKRLLKADGITYARVATHLQLSEATVKRQFSLQSFSLRTLEAICDLLHIELSELVQAAAQSQSTLHNLSAAQEKELVADPGRLLTAVCVLNHWSAARIVETYRISKAQCVSHLAQLDRLGLIHLMPENRVRLRIARDFAWLPDGPIQRFFQDRIQSDFLNGRFDQPGQQLRFHHAMLTAEASARLQQRMQRLLREFAELHEDSKSAPDAQRFGTSLLMAVKPWEPQAFEALRRQPDARPFG
ncbi:helix-turn-helix transcriptional regulator [Duganella sp. BJB1802]|uniref:helix-turn-helix domain-containing protein n=1 Tax=Duganella sp. BJB1802 TaxID=2744575 RepID=UPI0015949FCF|nr:helix-turn-helix transcriptional regulator [Duganella sp. BJB1802]NVD69080.1 helix-turn-helix transcriptional regulator [Duganella sp. BJB1802]